MKRKIIVILSFLFRFVFCGCNPSGLSHAKYSVESTENVVVITVEEVKDAKFLMDIMEQAKADEKLAFEVSNGMITSINGKVNPADWSYCWMLYTSDAELSNNEWGSVEYAGQTLGSAVLGAESLPVAAGEVYVWVYTKF